MNNDNKEVDIVAIRMYAINYDALNLKGIVRKCFVTNW